MLNTTNNPHPQVSYTLTADELEAFAQRKKEEGKLEAIAELKAKNALEKPCLTRKEAMTALGISESTIIEWGKRGFLRSVKHGHRCMYFMHDVDRILMSGTINASNPD